MWACSSGAAPDCVGSDLYDPPARTLQGEPLCLACARALGCISPHDSEREDESDRDDFSARDDAPYGLTD
ncbi:hypothetical protein [Salinilacihabitans rarus]|uniref:hypothetical protein n=1 Tax=Salinilacihabitans rarus TaxID=2961596 RepID=UPI0020C8474D|nr:hypothetical protein [Salinilacihabitans rarus]